MAVYLFWQGQIQGHQHGRPDNGVEADDFFPHKMHVSGPVFLIVGIVAGTISHGCNIVGKGVQPYIYHMFGIKIYRDSPGETGAGNTQVVQAVLDEVDHLVLSAFRLDKIGLILIKL